jgi:uncharacterized protein YndB with AHSA1/START domain
MADVETGVVINRPAEEVFDHWADGRLYNDWQPAAIKRDIRLLTPEPIGRGARFHGTFKGAGELEYEITDYDRPRRLAMVTHTRLGELRHTITCTSVSGGTSVSQIGEGRFRGLYQLLKPLLLLVFRRTFQQNDRALKWYLEGRERQGMAETRRAG